MSLPIIQCLEPILLGIGGILMTLNIGVKKGLELNFIWPLRFLLFIYYLISMILGIPYTIFLLIKTTLLIIGKFEVKPKERHHVLYYIFGF